MTSESDRFTVEIESGLYAGVAETLPAGRYTIGSSIEADIVLVEDGLAPHHLAVDTLGPAMRVEALADGVVIEGVATLRSGEARTMTLPMAIRIGAMRLTWRGAGGKSKKSRMQRPSVLAMGGFLSHHVWAVAAILIGGGLLFVPNPVADASVGSRHESVAQQPGPASLAAASAPAGAAAASWANTVTSPTPERATAPSPQLPTRIELKRTPDTAPARQSGARPARNGGEVAAEALRVEIEKAGFLNVTVAPGAGVVTATGTVEPTATSRWQGVQQWFDERFGGEVTLVNGVTVKADKLPVSLAIEAVWRGQHPHLIIRGQKYLEGALIEGGWAIQRIETERVLLQREGRLVAVKY